MSTIGTITFYFLKFSLFSGTLTVVSKVAGARYTFALWACVPAIWFFQHAPWYVTWAWYGLSTTAAADLRWNIPVPRMVIFFYLAALAAIMVGWQYFKNSREVSGYTLLFLAVAVPLEPAFDFIDSVMQSLTKSG
jgi:hypothetical protein